MISDYTDQQSDNQDLLDERSGQLTENLAAQVTLNNKRTKQIATFNTKKAELDELIPAVDEVIPEIQKLFEDFRPNQVSPSLIQIQSTSSKVNAVLVKAKKTNKSPLLTAILELTSSAQYFSDAESVQKIIDLLKEF